VGQASIATRTGEDGNPRGKGGPTSVCSRRRSGRWRAAAAETQALCGLAELGPQHPVQFEILEAARMRDVRPLATLMLHPDLLKHPA